MDGNVGLADAMLRLKEKAEEMVREQVVLRREQEELQGNNKWLFFELESGHAVEAPAAAKRHDLEARSATTDTGRAVALGLLEEEVARLVALKQELREKATG